MISYKRKTSAAVNVNKVNLDNATIIYIFEPGFNCSFRNEKSYQERCREQAR